jgi:hypothetical protein
MPRYFFNFVNGLTSIDVRGRDLPNLESAVAHAQVLARTARVSGPGGRIVVVTDENDVEVYRTPVTG